MYKSTSELGNLTEPVLSEMGFIDQQVSIKDIPSLHNSIF